MKDIGHFILIDKNAEINVLSSFVSILLRERERGGGGSLLNYNCAFAVVLCLFLAMPRVGLWSIFVAFNFPDYSLIS